MKMECFTCKITAAVDKSYPVREAVYGKASGRCSWHAWDDDNIFMCSSCKTPRFFEQVAWCTETDHLICTECSPSRTVKDTFWFWKEYTLITCPYCGKEHPTLNRQEFQGEHPWQADPFRCRQFPIWYPDGRLVKKEDLTQEKHRKQKRKQKSIVCPYCRTRLSVSEPGTYECPHCHQIFTVSLKGT
ncbi:MAG: hypothetical protein HXS54_01675 [Theionarchaea archaeon]|nr:hypothetical protein [Theionarchaea archaeon]